MSKVTIEFQDTNGVTKTYQKEFGEDVVFVGDYFEACLEAYDSFGYVNDIDVDVYGPEGVVVQTISWDKDNYINNSDDFPVDDVESFLWQGVMDDYVEGIVKKAERPSYLDDVYESFMEAMAVQDRAEHKPIKVKDFKITLGDEDISHMFKRPTENWYMGHRY